MVKLIISTLGKDQLSLMWIPDESKGHGEGQQTTINRAKFNAVVEQVLSKANYFVSLWKTYEKKGATLTESEWELIPSLGNCLKGMAKNGSDLLNLILPDDDHAADCIKSYLGEYDRIRIIYNNLTSLLVPWGLCYGPGPEPNQTSNNILQYFWGCRFALSVGASGISSTGHLGLLEDGGVFPLLNWNEFMTQRNTLEKDEQKFADAIYYLAPKILDDTEHLNLAIEDLHEQIQGRNLLYYVYSHVTKDSNNSNMKFHFGNEAHELTPQHFAKILHKQEQLGRGKKTLFFLNACNSDTRPALEFLIHGQKTCMGCIVSEANIPIRFGMRFGIEFIDAWLQNSEKLIDAFHRIGLKNLPFSLFYTLYCQADFTRCAVEPSDVLVDQICQDRYRKQVQNVNFSVDGAFV